MSPSTIYAVTPFTGFPRVSGDEPLDYAVQAAWYQFSPRERG